jgi:hypothetical protein
MEASSTMSPKQGTTASVRIEILTVAALKEVLADRTFISCPGVVPVTLVNSKKRSIERSDFLPRQEATHASYSGSVLFKNTFEGQLPAAEYPKIGVRSLPVQCKDVETFTKWPIPIRVVYSFICS